MPHKLMVTLPVGTSGEPAAALDIEASNCAPSKVAPNRRGLISFIYSVGEGHRSIVGSVAPGKRRPRAKCINIQLYLFKTDRKEHFVPIVSSGFIPAWYYRFGAPADRTEWRKLVRRVGMCDAVETCRRIGVSAYRCGRPCDG